MGRCGRSWAKAEPTCVESREDEVGIDESLFEPLPCEGAHSNVGLRLGDCTEGGRERFGVYESKAVLRDQKERERVEKSQR